MLTGPVLIVLLFVLGLLVLMGALVLGGGRQRAGRHAPSPSAKTENTCRQCGHANVSSAQYCSRCGHALGDEPHAPT